jgi:hypothetical protein
MAQVVPAYQVWGSELKPRTAKKKKEKRKKNQLL